MSNGFKNISDKIKKLVFLLIGLAILLLPVAFLLMALCLPKLVWNISFDNYLKFLEILIWPVTILIILYFFKRVVTYLFFSMNEFNFFGAKGNLRDINEVIREEVDKKFVEEKNEKERNEAMSKLSNEINTTKGTAEQNLNLAKEVLKEWKNSTRENKKLKEENKKLKEAIERKNQFVGSEPSVLNESDIGTGDKIDDPSLGNPK